MIENTLFICKTKCYKCNQDYNAAYMEKHINGHNITCSPDTFSEKIKALVKENDVTIKTLGYGDPNYPDVYTVNVCPHCNAPFGNNHIKELIGKEIKTINL